MRTAVRLFAVATLFACGDNEAPEQANAFWTKLQELDYRRLARVPGYEERRASSQPHGDLVDIYFNETAQRALQSTGPLQSWPDGSLFVKDGFHDDGSLDVVTAMEKRDGAWFWAEFTATGAARYSGTPEVCLDCHGSGSDFVRAVALPR